MAGSDSTKFEVGKDILAWCGKCKQNTDHTVVALVDDRPKQVACTRCDAWHSYSRPRAEPPTPTGTDDRPRRRRKVAFSGAHRGRVRPAPVSAATAEERWREAVAAATGEPQPYDYRGGYQVGDLVQHPSHGLCVVTSTATPRRVTVLARSGEQVLLTPGARNR